MTSPSFPVVMQLAAPFHDSRLGSQYRSADLGPGQACCGTDFVLLLHFQIAELLRTEIFRDGVPAV